MAYKLPGHEIGRTFTPREIAWGGAKLEYMPGGATWDANKSYDGSNGLYPYEIRAGWALGRITASNLVVPCKRTIVTSSAESSSTLGSRTVFSVRNAAAFKIGDVITINTSQNHTITNVNYSTNRITIADPENVTNNDIVVAQDGSQTCIGFSDEFAKLTNFDNTAPESKFLSKHVIGGVLNKVMLLGDIDAIIADATSKANLAGRLKIWDPANFVWSL